MLVNLLCSDKLFSLKAHIFCEGHKILRNIHRRFVLCSNGQIYGKNSQKCMAFSEYMNFKSLDNT